MSESSAQSTVGPVLLAEGVRKFNFRTFMYAAFICVGMLAGMNFLQSYVLTAHLQIPSAERGAVTGVLAFWTEISAILMIVPFGILSDRIGRRPVMVGGILFLALGYALFPFATSAGELIVYRIVFAIGAAPWDGVPQRCQPTPVSFPEGREFSPPPPDPQRWR